ncbi:MAG: hypothetical protein JNG84_03815 [Archangium sp.]|nr:hypothetical protein [Archangium sp.]
MADTDPNDSGLELDIKPKPSSPSSSRPSGTLPSSSPSGLRSGTTGVRSAYRTQPLPALAPEKKLSKAALKEGAIDTLLNSVSVLAELVEDFRSSDRFFKYKAMVLGTWLFLSLSTFAVACPSQGPANDIEAHLVVVKNTSSTPIYMVKNNSVETWNDVEVIVNGVYRSTTAQVPSSDSIGLSPAVLFDAEGQHAPASLSVSDIEVRVLEPEGRVKLLVGGRQP